MKKILLITALFLGACGAADSVTNNLNRIDESHLARPAFMVERPILIEKEEHLIWERMHQRHAPARLYLGGADDLGLKLAARDRADNLLWAPVLNNGHLDRIKSLYTLTGFEVILINDIDPPAQDWLTARSDILSIRSVAATLPVLNKAAPALANIPQVHFTGAMDDTQTPARYHNFRQAMGPSDCVKYALLPSADETDGWVNIWPKLLKIVPECKTDMSAAPVTIDAAPIPPIKLYEK